MKGVSQFSMFAQSKSLGVTILNAEY